jgi:hypothetical protein
MEENNEINEMDRKPKHDCNMDFLSFKCTIMRVLAVVCLIFVIVVVEGFNFLIFPIANLMFTYFEYIFYI